MALRIDKLSYAYGDISALQGISASPRAGAITAVIGPNASGKSTLLTCMIGGLKPATGAVLLDNTPVHRMKPARIAQRVAYVPQRATVAAGFSVREVIELGRYVLPADPQRIDDALHTMQLMDLAHRRYQQLSVGQQQRVTLARALAQLSHDETSPGILILDEPTSAMDLQHAQHTATVLRDLAQRSTTIIIAMHDLSHATMLADDAWLLQAGQLFAAGRADDVLSADNLAQVFEVDFAAARTDTGRTVLIPQVADRNSP